MPVQITDPVEAKEIAAVAMVLLSDIRASQSLPELNKAIDGWMSYANTKRIAKPIRDHFQATINEVAAILKARSVVRDPTGEAA